PPAPRHRPGSRPPPARPGLRRPRPVRRAAPRRPSGRAPRAARATGGAGARGLRSRRVNLDAGPPTWATLRALPASRLERCLTNRGGVVERAGAGTRLPGQYVTAFTREGSASGGRLRDLGGAPDELGRRYARRRSPPP